MGEGADGNSRRQAAGGRLMRHVRGITVAKASTKDMSSEGALFFQLWLTVLSTILMAGLGQK